MIIKGLKVTEDQIRYVFPRSLQPIKTFTNVHELGTILRKHFKDTKLPNFPYRHIAQNKGYVQCQYCPNALVYVLSEDKKTYELDQFSVEHIHSKDIDKHEKYKNSWISSFKDFKTGKKQIEKLLSIYSENVENKQTEQQAQPQSFTSFDQMISHFKSNDYYVYYEPKQFKMGQAYPDLLLVITPGMKQMYLKYGRCIGFDFTFNMIREIPLKTRGSKQQYLIGVIAGLNSFRRITIYGLVASTKQSPKTIETIFAKFFQYTGKYPESIVTDQAIGMLYGIRNLQTKGLYKGASYWDTFHVLKSYTFKTDELRKGIRHMVRQKCPYKFQKMYLQAVNIANCEQQMDSLHKFMHQSQKYCISHIAPVFVGLGVSDTQNQIAHNVIKSELPYQEKYLSVISKLVGFLNERNLLTSVCVRETCKIQEVINQREFQMLRLALPMKVHSFFYTQFYKATAIEIIIIENDRTIFYVQDSDEIYRVNLMNAGQNGNQKSLNKKIYQCSCYFKIKTGVPCEHILKIVIIQKVNILDQIDPYYVIEDPQNMQACTMTNQKMEEKVRKRGRPAWKAVFYVQRKNMEKLPDKIATVKVRQKNQWGGWTTNKMEKQKNQSSLMLVPQEEQSQFPQYAKSTKLTKNRNQMMKKFYSHAAQNM